MMRSVCDVRHTLQFSPGASITSSQIDWLKTSLGGPHVTNTINGFSGNGTTSVGTSRTPQQSGRDTAVATTGATQPDSADEVRITATASSLVSLGRQLSSLPPIDSARVARIAQALETGTYSISADKIASGLLQSEQTLAQIDS